MELNNLDSIVKYSKFSHSLDKIFRGQSLEELLKRFKNKVYYKVYDNQDSSNPKNMKKLDMISEKLSIFPQIRDNINSNDQNFDFEQIKQNFEKKKTKQKNKQSLLDEENSKYLFELKKKKIDLIRGSNPDPGKYNPNYEYISKKVPSISMKTKISENLKDKVNKLQEERIKRVNDRINIKIEKKRINLVKADIEKHLLAIKHRDTEISKTMTNPLVTDASVSRNVINTTSNNNLTTTIDHLNTNSSDNSFAEKSKVLKKSKGINFEKYSPRKNIFYTGNSPPILTYIEPAYSFSKEKIDKTFDLKKNESSIL